MLDPQLTNEPSPRETLSDVPGPREGAARCAGKTRLRALDLEMLDLRACP